MNNDDRVQCNCCGIPLCRLKPVVWSKRSCVLFWYSLFGMMVLGLYSATTVFAFRFAHSKVRRMNRHIHASPLGRDSEMFTLNITSVNNFICKHFNCKENDSFTNNTIDDNDFNQGYYYDSMNESDLFTNSIELIQLNQTEVRIYRCCLTAAYAIPSLQKSHPSYWFRSKVEWSRCHREMKDTVFSDINKTCQSFPNVTELIPLRWDLAKGSQFRHYTSHTSSLTPGITDLTWSKHYNEYAYFVLATVLFWITGVTTILRVAGAPVIHDVRVWLHNLTLVSSLMILQWLTKLLMYYAVRDQTKAYCNADNYSLTDPTKALEHHECDDMHWKSTMPFWLDALFKAAVWAFAGSFGLFFMLICYVLIKLWIRLIPENNAVFVCYRRCKGRCSDKCSECCVNGGFSTVIDPLVQRRSSSHDSTLFNHYDTGQHRISEVLTEIDFSDRSMTMSVKHPSTQLSCRSRMLHMMSLMLIWANYLSSVFLFVVVICNVVFVGLSFNKPVAYGSSRGILVLIITVSNTMLALLLMALALWNHRRRILDCFVNVTTRFPGCDDRGPCMDASMEDEDESDADLSRDDGNSALELGYSLEVSERSET